MRNQECTYSGDEGRRFDNLIWIKSGESRQSRIVVCRNARRGQGDVREGRANLERRMDMMQMMMEQMVKHLQAQWRAPT